MKYTLNATIRTKVHVRKIKQVWWKPWRSTVTLFVEGTATPQTLAVGEEYEVVMYAGYTQ